MWPILIPRLQGPLFSTGYETEGSAESQQFIRNMHVLTAPGERSNPSIFSLCLSVNSPMSAGWKQNYNQTQASWFQEGFLFLCQFSLKPIHTYNSYQTYKLAKKSKNPFLSPIWDLSNKTVNKFTASYNCTYTSFPLEAKILTTKTLTGCSLSTKQHKRMLAELGGKFGHSLHRQVPLFLTFCPVCFIFLAYRFRWPLESCPEPATTWIRALESFPVLQDSLACVFGAGSRFPRPHVLLWAFY